MEGLFDDKFAEINISKVSQIIKDVTPKKFCKYNEPLSVTRRVIEVFCQFNKIMDFDPQAEVEKLYNLKISQETFCDIFRDVLCIKIKKYLKTVNSVADHSRIPQEEINAEKGSQDYNRYIKMIENQKKLFSNMLDDVRHTATILEKLIVATIRIFGWRCEIGGRTCDVTYVQDHLWRLILKNFIAKDPILEVQIYIAELYFYLWKGEKTKFVEATLKESMGKEIYYGLKEGIRCYYDKTPLKPLEPESMKFYMCDKCQDKMVKAEEDQDRKREARKKKKAEKKKKMLESNKEDDKQTLPEKKEEDKIDIEGSARDDLVERLMKEWDEMKIIEEERVKWRFNQKDILDIDIFPFKKH